MGCLTIILAGARRGAFRRWLALLLAAGVIALATAAAADIYRYVDDEGVIHYTDDIDRVPAQYRDIVEQKKSVRRDGASEPPPQPRKPLVVETAAEHPDSPPAGEAAAAEPAAEQGQKQEIPGSEAQGQAGGEAPESESAVEEGGEGQPPEPPPEAQEGAAGDSPGLEPRLEKERASLLRQKEALADNRTYQKRKITRKYVTRPHVRKLLEAEARIEARLGEIEEEVN